MHISLTDVLACPRCGSGFGLILLADAVENRRVRVGRLGCSNCREQYSVRDGLVDLRWRAAPTEARPRDGGTGADVAVRTAALLGVSEGPARLLLAGAAAARAGEVAAMIPAVQVIALDSHPQPGPDLAGVSRVWSADGIPAYGESLQGVALAATDTDLIDEAARVLAPGARLLVESAEPGIAARLEALGLRVLLTESGVVVAERPGRGIPPRRPE